MKTVIWVALVLVGCGGASSGPPRQLSVSPGADAGVACGPGSCLGCCFGDVCLEGNVDLACGYSGRACLTCPATHACEAPGVCMPALPSADAGGAGAPIATDAGIDPYTLEERRRRRCIPFLTGWFCT